MPSLYDTFKAIYTAEDPKTVLQTLECLLKATKEVEFIAAPKYYMHCVRVKTGEITYMYSTQIAECYITIVSTDSTPIETFGQLLSFLKNDIVNPASGQVTNSSNQFQYVVMCASNGSVGDSTVQQTLLINTLPVSQSDIELIMDNVQEVK